MTSRTRQTSKYLFYALYTNVVFGFIYYFMFMWLVEYSLLYAYAGSLALIAIGLGLDEYLKNQLTAKRIVEELERSKEKDRVTIYRIFRWFLDSFVSFKTILYIFYFLILVASQIDNIHPALVNESLSDFVLANSYGIVLLIAFDRIIGQFSKDRKEMKKRSQDLKNALNETQGLSSSLPPED